MATKSLESDIAEIVENLGDAAQGFAGKTILLTGARGFIGHYFAATFAKLNKDVLKEPATLVGLDNLITAGPVDADEEDTAEIRFIHHDVIEPFAWDGPVHFVAHAAGIASPYYYRAYPLETLEVSVTGTRLMLELARQHGAHFLFFSSSEIYGDPDATHVPTPESYRGNVSCQGPRACYDESKRIGETLCHIFHHKYGTATNAVRPFNVYGPGMKEADYRVLPNFASRMKAALPANIYGSGTQTRTFCYITDAMDGFLRVMLRGVPGEAYNIGSPKPEVSMLDLVRALERVLGRSVPYNLIEYPDSYPADEPRRRCPDIRKARTQLEFAPRMTLDEGLRRFFGWADTHYTGEM